MLKISGGVFFKYIYNRFGSKMNIYNHILLDMKSQYSNFLHSLSASIMSFGFLL